jgi:hypothetical protein
VVETLKDTGEKASATRRTHYSIRRRRLVPSMLPLPLRIQLVYERSVPRHNIVVVKGWDVNPMLSHVSLLAMLQRR